MKYFFLIVFIVIKSHVSLAQIPIDKHQKAINALDSSDKIQKYWKKLYNIDQNLLLKTKDDKKRDSISIDNMIRTALMLEIHGIEVITPNVAVHILNLSHNKFGVSNLAYWPIIKTSKEIGQAVTEQLYPAYVLESIGLTFYGYSFLRKEDKYPRALNILNNSNRDKNIVEELIVAFQKIKKYKNLKNQKTIGVWYQKYFKNREEKDTFKFILKEDGNLYFKMYSNLNKLILLNENDSFKIYRVENEPYGWTFKLENSGQLSLLDHNNNILIEYRTVENSG